MHSTNAEKHQSIAPSQNNSNQKPIYSSRSLTITIQIQVTPNNENKHYDIYTSSLYYPIRHNRLRYLPHLLPSTALHLSTLLQRLRLISHNKPPPSANYCPIPVEHTTQTQTNHAQQHHPIPHHHQHKPNHLPPLPTNTTAIIGLINRNRPLGQVEHHPPVLQPMQPQHIPYPV